MALFGGITGTFPFLPFPRHNNVLRRGCQRHALPNMKSVSRCSRKHTSLTHVPWTRGEQSAGTTGTLCTNSKNIWTMNLQHIDEMTTEARKLIGTLKDAATTHEEGTPTSTNLALGRSGPSSPPGAADNSVRVSIGTQPSPTPEGSRSKTFVLKNNQVEVLSTQLKGVHYAFICTCTHSINASKINAHNSRTMNRVPNRSPRTATSCP